MRVLRLLKKLISTPVHMLHAKLSPVSYARRLGVTMKGQVTIYGSSYAMFSAEPYLVTLGDNVFISVGARFVCHDGSTLPFRREIPDLDVAGEIILGDNIFVGTGALVLPGVRIGSNCIIGANAVVTRDVPDNSVAAGNPARVVNTIERYREKAQARSLHIGHLTGETKAREYKRIFGKL